MKAKLMRYSTPNSWRPHEDSYLENGEWFTDITTLTQLVKLLAPGESISMAVADQEVPYDYELVIDDSELVPVSF